MKKVIFKKFVKDVSLFFLVSIISISIIVWIIQAVNYLDLVSEDGHSFKIYFLFTLYSLPKIISKIFPFIFVISLFYILIKYELNNELIIYWLNGISKINFINNIIKLSLIFFLIQIIFTSLIVPYTLDKGRSFFRSSNIDLFSSIIKEKTFNDTVKNLTVFVENKNDNFLNNIIIKEKINNNKSQLITAKSGEIIFTEIDKRMVLYDGKIINYENKQQSIVDFSEFYLNLAKYSTNTITNPKIQEMNSLNLLRCLDIMIKNNLIYKINQKKNFFTGCDARISLPIIEENLKRFISPLFIILLSLCSSLIIFNNKNNGKFKTINVLFFLICLTLIIISESSISAAASSIENTLIYIFFPIVIFKTIYLIFYFKMNLKKLS